MIKNKPIVGYWLTRRNAQALLLAVFLAITACSSLVPPATSTPDATLVPTASPLPILQATPLPTLQEVPTDEPTLIVPVIDDPLLGEAVPPPLDITLPEGWKHGSDAIVLPSEMYRTVPLALYTGPVTGGTGYIILLWGFPNLGINPFQLDQTQLDQVLFADALRLFRMAIVDVGCNPGTDLQQEYRVGERAATGTQFAIVSCPQGLPDTRGWFAALQEGGLNFVFFVYTEPIDAMNTAQTELQAVLDTVRFRVPEATPTPAP